MSILNKAQAEAVYSAMCAINNVSGSIDKIMLPAPYYVISVVAYGDEIIVRQGLRDMEKYANQAAFAAAYGLNADEPEMVKHLGLSFKVLAKFTADDTKAANAFMAANPNAGLLCIENGIAYLVDMADDGVVA